MSRLESVRQIVDRILVGQHDVQERRCDQYLPRPRPARLDAILAELDLAECGRPE